MLGGFGGEVVLLEKMDNKTKLRKMFQGFRIDSMR